MSKQIIEKLYKIEKEEEHYKFLLDSGAFTAFNAGKTITLDEYCTFLEKLPFTPWKYFTLDVIGDPVATQKNYDIMIKRGFTPAPIFTYGEDLSIIDEMYKTSDFIGIGGLVGVPSNKMILAVDSALKKVRGRKAHLLGFTRVEYLKYFKPYSCDSSSWEGGARFGFTEIYNLKGRMIKIKRKDILKKPSFEQIAAFKRYNIDYRKLGKKEEWSGGLSTIRKTSANGWVELAGHAERKIKTKIFLAFATNTALDLLYDAYTHQKGNK